MSGVVPSLDMECEMVDGKCMVDAPWLEEPVSADTWEEAFEKARAARAVKEPTR